MVSITLLIHYSPDILCATQELTFGVAPVAPRDMSGKGASSSDCCFWRAFCLAFWRAFLALALSWIKGLFVVWHQTSIETRWMNYRDWRSLSQSDSLKFPCKFWPRKNVSPQAMNTRLYRLVFLSLLPVGAAKFDPQKYTKLILKGTVFMYAWACIRKT